MPPIPPDALLFIAPHCAHCPTVLDTLTELTKQTVVGKLTVINVTAHPELAEQYGVRVAPWLKLGDFTLTGTHTPSELRQWATWANSTLGTSKYIEYLLQKGVYKQAAAFISEDMRRLEALLNSIANIEASIDVRLGISALLESHANTLEFKELLPELSGLTQHADHRVRTDACYLLGLTGMSAASQPLELCLNDSHEEVREVAKDALEALKLI